MSTSRVLLIGTKVPLSQNDSLAADVVSTVQEALDRLAAGGYSALICWAERQDELAAVIRIRKASSATPILLVTPQTDPEYAALARQLGATRVIRPDKDPGRMTDLIRNALLSGELASELQSHVARAESHTREIRELTRKNRELTETAQTRLHGTPRLAFTPLIVEGNPELAFRTLRALQRADVFAPLPVLKDRDEAIAYLNHLSTPGMEGLRIQPSIILLDLDLPDEGGLEILKWIRSQPPFSLLPVVAFGSTHDAATIARAYELGVNSYLLKPDSFDAHVQCLASLKIYWGSFNQGTSPF
jgi:DNA-binding NarL/FixJ family response regulator